MSEVIWADASDVPTRFLVVGCAMDRTSGAVSHPPIQAVVEALKDKGLRVTPQRCAVYANLLGRTDHPTVDQLLRDLNRSFPISSQATVYSSLQALQNAGLVREVLLEEGVARYDANMTPHHHFRCRCCGSIEDIDWSVLSPLRLDNLRSGLKPDGYEVTVHGVCDHCPG